MGQATPPRPPLRLPVRANPFPSNKKRGRPINKGPKQHPKRCNSAVSSCRTDVSECDISAHAFSTLQHIDPGSIISRHLDRNDVRRPSRTFTLPFQSSCSPGYPTTYRTVKVIQASGSASSRFYRFTVPGAPTIIDPTVTPQWTLVDTNCQRLVNLRLEIPGSSQ